MNDLEKSGNINQKLSMAIYPLMKYLKQKFNFKTGGFNFNSRLSRETSNASYARGRSVTSDGKSSMSSANGRNHSHDAAALSFNDQMSYTSMLDNVNTEINEPATGKKTNQFSFEE